MLRGLEKFRIVEERFARDGAQRYRMARIESLKEPPRASSGAAAEARRRLEQVIAKRLQRNADDTIPKDIPDTDLIHAIAQHLEPLEKQALLECNGLLERCRTLVELLEMKTLVSPGGKTRLH
jgi:Lon protease-like protein